MKELLDRVRSRFAAVYRSGCCISVDEAMIPFKGKIHTHPSFLRTAFAHGAVQAIDGVVMAMCMCWYILSDTWSQCRSFRVAYAIFLVHGQPLPLEQTSAEGTLELALGSSGVFLPSVVHQPSLRLGQKRTPRLAAGPSVLGRCHTLSSLLPLVFAGLHTHTHRVVHVHNQKHHLQVAQP